MSDGRLRYIASSMDAKLPYTLTKGVTATREGLEFKAWLTDTLSLFKWRSRIELQVEFVNNDVLHQRISWPDAAERLRYREFEPWCRVAYDGYDLYYENGSFDEPPGTAHSVLHRIAAILCDDAEAFRILHWCIHNICNPVEIDGVTPDE